MRAVVLIPYRPAGFERMRNFKFVSRWWQGHGWPIVVGDSLTPQFERAQARNIAAREAGEWDVALFCDADIFLNRIDQAEAAILRCYRTGAYTVAYSHLHYLTEDGTRNVFRVGVDPTHFDWDEVVAHTWECCFAVRRDVWDEVGGFDERFLGYGGQVAAFFYAAGTLAGRERIYGSAYHLAHPLVNRDLESNFEANCRLADRYREAVDDPAAIREILRERA